MGHCSGLLRLWLALAVIFFFCLVHLRTVWLHTNNLKFCYSLYVWVEKRRSASGMRMSTYTHMTSYTLESFSFSGTSYLWFRPKTMYFSTRLLQEVGINSSSIDQTDAHYSYNFLPPSPSLILRKDLNRLSELKASNGLEIKEVANILETLTS